MLPKSHILLLAAGILLLTSSCSEAARFRRLERQILRNWPVPSKTVWPEDLSPAGYLSLDSFLLYASRSLEAIDVLQLPPKEQPAYRRLQQKLGNEREKIDRQASNPSIYNLPGHWKALLARQTLSDAEKLQQLREQLPLAPAYYRNAQEKLSRPDPAFLQLAVQKHIAGIAFLDGELRTFIQQSKSPDQDKAQLLQQLDSAKLAAKAYIAWCNSAWLNL